VAGIRGGRLVVRVAAAPVDNAANEALIVFLAKALRVPIRTITIVKGARSRTKRIAIAGLTAADLESRLAAVAQTP